ncbi:cutinase-domain-containing protein [Ampelomyces quisqualis]|uniref:Cutinase n=1 Tax=Ampelomyces quisqualis TaxID=50730 RepID=A0A6A5QFI4_AMPQU|nr:cutinase-domain-containing protein [Ampelomyces quisqualis]
MKCIIQSLLPLSLLVSGALGAPVPVPAPTAEGASFPITDLLGSDLTVNEYAAQLEGQNPEPALTKRQFNGDTYNQFTDGTACRDVTVIYARGTTGDGNVGEPNSEGPTFFNALASRLGGASRLAIQGVNYPASVIGFLAGGDAAGATTTFNLINQAASRCPSTKIVLSGYSQGAQLVHTATQRLSAANAARVSASEYPQYEIF